MQVWKDRRTKIGPYMIMLLPPLFIHWVLNEFGKTRHVCDFLTLWLFFFFFFIKESFLVGLPPADSVVKSACNARDTRDIGFDPWVRKNPLEEEMTTHFSFLAWKIPMDESLMGYSPEFQRVRRDWVRTHASPSYFLIKCELFISP